MNVRVSKIIAGLAFVALITLLVWRLKKTEAPAPRSSSATTPTITETSLNSSKRAVPTPSPPDPSTASPAVLQLNSSSSTVIADLQIVSNVLEAFRTNFPAQGNPVGENSEITAALTGDNPLHVAFIPPNHPAINAHGDLCDRWSTPFFFHQLSRTQMEIRSAGPDRKLWTGDDIVLTP